MMQAVIMAGGKGTRLATLTKDEIPKPMVPVAGKPLLLWQVERLKENGITDIIMVIGHLGDKIREYFGDGEKFGVAIRYFEETEPLGTAGSFYYLKDMIHGDRFVMMSGDLFFDIDFQRMINFHEERARLRRCLYIRMDIHLIQTFSCWTMMIRSRRLIPSTMCGITGMRTV